MNRLKYILAALAFACCVSVYAGPSALLTKPCNIHVFEENYPVPKTSLTTYEDTLIKHVQFSIGAAEKGLSNLNENILNIHGMSSAKNRHFLNNICNFPYVNYLEIGCWKGSTFISALYENQNPYILLLLLTIGASSAAPMKSLKAIANNFYLMCHINFIHMIALM